MAIMSTTGITTNKTMRELLSSGKPATVLQRLKDFRAAMDMPGTAFNPPMWYMQECTPDRPSLALCNLLRDAIEEIEMHQRINGDLYKKLFPS
jgi:hypothetical protein